MKNKNKGNHKSDSNGSTTFNYLNGKLPNRRVNDLAYSKTQQHKHKFYDSLAQSDDIETEDKIKIVKF